MNYHKLPRKNSMNLTINIKNALKMPLKKAKRQVTQWEKIFAVYPEEKGFISWIYEKNEQIRNYWEHGDYKQSVHWKEAWTGSKHMER